MTGEVIFWLVAFVALAALEIATMQLVSIWFAAGAFVAMISAALNVPLWCQFLLFAAISALLLALTRPLARRMMRKPATPTNAELDIGRTASVIEEINNANSTGRVELNGVNWMARSTAGEEIPEGRRVVVDRVEGAKLYVSSVKEE